MKTVALTIAALAITTMSLPPAYAANPGTPESVAGAGGAEMALEGPDVKFISEAIQGGMAEVELGKLATSKAGAADVKKFAQTMVDDHTAANKKLTDLAAKYKVEQDGTYGTPPLKLPEKAQAVHDRLAQLSGKEFDRAYMKQMVEDHQTTVALFKTEAKDGKNAEVKSLAEATLPTLEHHLSMARDLSKEVQAALN